MIGLSGKPREIGAFFMYTKLKNLYTISRVCIAKPHFLYKPAYLRKIFTIFSLKLFSH